MSEDAALKCILAVYLFVLSFVVFYGVDIITQHLFHKDIDWTKYIGNALSHGFMVAFGATQGWSYCKDWYEGENNGKR
jgi:hypothetical protein